MSPSAIIETNDTVAPSMTSYAQAAKGSNTVPASNSATASTDPVASAQDDQASTADTGSAAVAADEKASLPASEHVNSETPENADSPAVASEKQDLESVPGSESDARSESTQSRRTESRREDDGGRTDRPWRRNEKTPRSSSNATRSVDEQDSRKARRGKKGKASEKQAGEQATDKEQETVPEPPKVELSEAPIPSVNVWHKRKEAHQAKSTKPAPTHVEATVNGTSSHKDDKKAEVSPAPHTNGVKSHQRQNSAIRAERNGPRGSRMNEKDGKSEVPPSVDDSAAWPTPETAISTIKEDGKKKAVEKIPEKSDRSDKDSQEDGSSSKPRQKWVNVNFVPTVNFETQLPQMRGSKPRGGARGSRDTTNRAATNGATDKLASTSPATKVNDNKPRDTSNNAASQSASKRASVEIANGQKKTSTNAGSDKAKDPSVQTTETPQASRDRPEGRGDRGRGGYRGRGHHGHSQSQHAISGPGYHGQGANASRAQGYSPPMRQGGHGGVFTPPSQRGRGRNGANNFHRMSAPNGGSRMPVAQPQYPHYDYAMAAPMEATPFPHPQFTQILMPALKAQVEYYFSVENLCKDMFLRGHMDSQGFVNLHFIAAFNRLRQLTEDINLIRHVCEESVELDYGVTDEGLELLRRREGWQTFVLPVESREPMARREPGNVTFRNGPHGYTNGQLNGVPQMPYGTAMYAQDPSVQHFAPHGVDGVAPTGTGQLSATVPDFSPSGTVPLVGPNGETQITSVEALTNGHAENTTPLTNGVHAESSQSTES
ncbi:la family [Fusarium flagelliforme]|uniref:La family n=1 Tax=Fusarium flagelliforme TaxID=2675880 RepID=A0A395MJX5_9HYPO|nr:la family [Fusarium flagelliforme]